MADLRISGASTNARSECDIRLNYGDPDKIIAAANDLGTFLQAQFYSTDGGVTWNPLPTTNLPLGSGDSFQSDPAVDWTSDGTAWTATLGVNATNTVLQLRIYTSSDGGRTWTLVATPSGTATNVDREIMWVDHSPTSPYKDQIYVTYHLASIAFVVRRTAGASGSWQTPVQVSGAETTGTPIGGDIKTNSFGDVFVFWPDSGGTNNILVAKSTNGGAAFAALGATPVTIGTIFASSRILSIPAFPRTVSGTTVLSRGARVYISGGAYRTATKNLVYAVWADLSGASGCTTGQGPGTSVASTCKTRIWFSRSTNGGANWSTPVMINNQASLNDQFHPRLVVDESNGILAVVYHDTVNDPNRLKTDLWMQTSIDDGVTWSTASKVTTAQTDETVAGTNQWKYGDYLGASGFHGTVFPAWTDRRSGTDEIWSSQLTLIQKQCYFIVDKSTFGQDEVQAMLLAGNSTVNGAFYVVVEGFTAGELGVSSADLSGAPGTKPTLTSSPAVAGMTIGQPTALLAEDPSLPATPQRFTWVYPVSFTNASGFIQPVLAVTLNATMATVAGNGIIELLQQPDPYEMDGQTTWLSTDLRVFQIKQSQSKFGATVGGGTPADAITFIQQVITNLNSGSTGGQTFENDLDPNATEVALFQTDTAGTAVFNFAIARVRYQAIAQDAQAVRVFFRVCPALTVSLAYDPTTTYRTYSDGVQYGQKIARLGTQNNNILTIPSFAAARVTPSASMDTQLDVRNVQTMVHNTTGAEIDQYFGCWLDFNQPGQTHFPINPTNDGPFAGTLKSILELVRNQHQCLVAEIAFDPDPISTGATPGSSDKLAQRNLSLVASANPGDVGSRRIPNTFELKPTQTESLQGYDELMIDWGNMPAGSVARIFLPTVSADEILELAAKRFSAADLTRVDDHTVECPVREITYVPIPPGPSLNHVGLLTLDLPPGVRKGQLFEIVVRQIAHAGRAILPQEPQIDVNIPEGSLAVKGDFDWRRVLGTFQISIPVQSKETILEPEERLLSVLRWILNSIPLHDRWYLVFAGYVEDIASRVRGLGGNPDRITPSPNGNGRAAPTARECPWLWGLPVLLATLVALIGTAPTPWSAPISAALVVLVAAALVLSSRLCHSSWCDVLGMAALGLSIGASVLGVVILIGDHRRAAVTLAVAALVMAGVLALALLSGCFAARLRSRS